MSLLASGYTPAEHTTTEELSRKQPVQRPSHDEPSFLLGCLVRPETSEFKGMFASFRLVFFPVFFLSTGYIVAFAHPIVSGAGAKSTTPTGEAEETMEGKRVSTAVQWWAPRDF